MPPVPLSMAPPNVPDASPAPTVSVAPPIPLLTTFARVRSVPAEARPLIVWSNALRSKVESNVALVFVTTTFPLPAPLGITLTAPPLRPPWLTIVSPVQSLVELDRITLPEPAPVLPNSSACGPVILPEIVPPAPALRPVIRALAVSVTVPVTFAPALASRSAPNPAIGSPAPGCSSGPSPAIEKLFATMPATLMYAWAPFATVTGPVPKPAMLPMRIPPALIVVPPVYVLAPVNCQRLLPTFVTLVGLLASWSATMREIDCVSISRGLRSVPARVSVLAPVPERATVPVPLKLIAAWPAVGEASSVAPAAPIVKFRFVDWSPPPAQRSVPPSITRLAAALAEEPMLLAAPPLARVVATSAPPVIVVTPVYELAAESVVAPEPTCRTAPAPLITPSAVEASLRLNTSAPALATALLPIEPVVPPAPTCSVLPAPIVVAPGVFVPVSVSVPAPTCSRTPLPPMLLA